MKRKILLTSVAALLLVGCAGGDGSLPSSSGSSSDSGSKETPTPISEKKIYDRLMEIGASRRFRMKEGDNYTIYHPSYIEYSSSQSGIAKVRGFEERYPEILMGFNYSLDGETKNYALNMVSQAESDDFETPATDLDNYLYFSLLEDPSFDITAEDITLYDDNETYGIIYDGNWTSETTNWLFYLVAGQLGYYSYASSGQVSEVVFTFNEADELVVALHGTLASSGQAFAVSASFDEIGTAKDEDLEAFLNSAEGQIPTSAISDSLYANLTSNAMSVTTEFSVNTVDGTLSSAITHLDFNEESRHFYIEGSETSSSYYRKNKNGNFDTVYIDGKNQIAYEDSGYSYDSLLVPASTICQEDLRASSSNASSFRYYGVNENAIVASFMGLDFLSYYGLSIQDMAFKVVGGKVKEIEARTYSFYTQVGNEYKRAYYAFKITIEDTLTEPGLPSPYEADESTADIKAIFDAMKGYDTVAFHSKEWIAGSENGEHPWMESENVFTSSIQYTKTTQWQSDAYGDWTSSTSVVGYLSKGEEGNAPFTFYPSGLKEMSGPLKQGALKEAAPIPFDAAPELFSFAANKTALKPKNDVVTEVLYKNLPFGPYGSVLPSSSIILKRRKDGEGNPTNQIDSISYTIDLTSYGTQMTIVGETTISYGEEVVVDETIEEEANLLTPFVIPTSWSTSYYGETISERFDAYFEGCVDKDRKALSVDLLPYKYIEGYDRSWSGYAWANGSFHMSLSDYEDSFRYSLMTEFRMALEADPSFEKKMEKETGKAYYVNGDLCVYVSDRADDGFILTKASSHQFE